MTTEASLQTLFHDAGKVESVQIPPGESPSHAFVVMECETDAARAIHALNGTQWNGLRLTVTQAGPVAGLRGFGGGNTLAERRNR